MRISVIITYLACSTSAQAKSFDRDHLTSLLERVDAVNALHDPDTELLAESIGSLLETDTKTWGYRSFRDWIYKRSSRWGPPPEPNRRRNHTPCECPDNLGDGTTTDCLNRRLVEFNTQYNAAFSVTSTGDSVESGRLSLRSFAADFNNDYNKAHSDAVDIKTNITDPSSGYQASIDRMSQRILNEEFLMAQSANSAWMNLIDVTTKASSEISGVNNNTIFTVRSIAKWFNSLQASEEKFTFGNMQRIINLANTQLNGFISQINKVKARVTSQFNQLESNTGGSEAKTSSLSDTLINAADKLSDNVDTFRQDIPMAGLNTDNKMSANLGARLQAYSTAAQASVNGYSTTGSSKKEAERKASSDHILSQRNSASGFFTSTRNNLQSTVNGISNKEVTFPDLSKKNYANVISVVDIQSQTNQNRFMNKTNVARNQLTNRDRQTSSLSDAVKTLLNDESKKVTDSGTTASNAKQAASGVHNEMTAGIGTKQNSILTSAQAAGTASVDAIGTNYRSSMDNMGSKYDSTLTSMSSNANAAASAAASATKGLAAAAGAGVNSVDAVQQAMTNNVRQAFSNVLNTVASIPGGISDAAASSLDMKTVLTTAKTDKAKAADMIQTALYGGRAVSLDQQAATEQAINALLAQIAQAGPSVRGLVDSVSVAVKTSSSAGTATVGSAGATGSSASKVVSETAGTVAQAEYAFANQLNNMVKQMITNPAGSGATGATVANAASSASDSVNTAKGQIDDLGKKTTSAAKKANDAIDRAREQVSASGQRAVDSFGHSSTTLGTHVDESAAEINTFFGQASSKASQTVANHLRDIEAAKELSVIQIGKITGDEMENLKAVAANADSLMQQISGFMTQNNPILFKAIQELATKAQGLFMRVQALRTQVADIGNSIDKGGPGQLPTDTQVKNIGTMIKTANVTAQNRLLKVGGDFNTTADRVATAAVGDVNKLVGEFLSASQSLKDALAKISTQTRAAEAALPNTDENRDVIAKLQQVNTAIGALANASQSQLLAIANQGVGGRPGNMDQLYKNVSAFSLNAGDGTAYATTQIDTIEALAGNNINAANLFIRNEGAISESEIDREASMAGLDENIALSQLAERRAALAQLNQNSTGLLQSYGTEARAQTAAQFEQANTIYDTVVKAKSDAAAMMGRIAQKYASQSSKLSTSVSSQGGNEAAKLSDMRNQLQVLLKLFDQYLTSTTGNFNKSDKDRDTFMDAVLLHASNLLKAGDFQLMDKSQELTDGVRSVTRVLNDVNEADIDNNINSIGMSFLGWEKSKKDTIAQEKVDISDIAKTVGFNSTAVQIKITEAVQNVAKSAKQLLVRTGKSTAGVDTALKNYKY